MLLQVVERVLPVDAIVVDARSIATRVPAITIKATRSLELCELFDDYSCTWLARSRTPSSSAALADPALAGSPRRPPRRARACRARPPRRDRHRNPH